MVVLVQFFPSSCHSLRAFLYACFGYNDHDVGSQSLAVTKHKGGVNFYVSDCSLYLSENYIHLKASR